MNPAPPVIMMFFTSGRGSNLVLPVRMGAFCHTSASCCQCILSSQIQQAAGQMLNIQKTTPTVGRQRLINSKREREMSRERAGQGFRIRQPLHPPPSIVEGLSCEAGESRRQANKLNHVGARLQPRQAKGHAGCGLFLRARAPKPRMPRGVGSRFPPTELVSCMLSKARTQMPGVLTILGRCARGLDRISWFFKVAVGGWWSSVASEAAGDRDS